MNKVIIIALFLLGVSTSNAQIKKGDIMMGGDLAGLNISFSNQTSFELTPKAAWFIKDGLAVGAYGQLGMTHVNGQDGSNYTYGIGSFGRYFFTDKLPAFQKAKLFVEANAGFQGVNSTANNSNTNGLGFGVGPGISYFITPNIGLEALLKYDGIVGFGSNTYTNGLTFSLGFQVYLPSKKVVKEIKSFE